MPEPLALAITVGVTTILGNLWNIIKDVYEVFSSIKNAPKHILALSQDIQGLYMVLGSLRGLLDNLSGDHLHSMLAPILESLKQPLDHCLSAFCELQQKINKYTKRSGEAKRSKWTAFWWEFTEKDTAMYQSHLASYKSTIDIALTTATLANTAWWPQNIHLTQNLVAQIQDMRIQLNEMEQRNADGLEHSIDADNGSQRTDRHFALHRFLETVEIAETAFSGSSPPSSPHFSAIQMSPRPCPPLPPLSPMQEEEVVSPSPHPPSYASAISNLSGRDVQGRQAERLRQKRSRFSFCSIVNDVFNTNQPDQCEGQRRHSLSPVRVSASKTPVETAEVVVVAKNGSKSRPAKPRKKASVEPLGDRTWTNGVVTPPGNRKRIRDPEISSPSIIHTNAAKETASPCPAGRNISEISNGCSSPLRRQPAQKRAARSREGIIVEKALPNLPKVTSSNVIDDAQSFLTKDSAAGEFVASTGRVMGVVLNPPTRVGLQYKSGSRSRERFVPPKATKKARRDKYEPELHDQVFTTRNSTTSPELLETVDSGISRLALHESTTSEARKKDRHHRPKSGAVVDVDHYCNGHDTRSPLERKDNAARVKRKRADFPGNKSQLPAKVRKQKTSSPKTFQDTSREILDERQKQPRRVVQEWLMDQYTGDFLVLGAGNDPLGPDRSDDRKPLLDGSRNGHLPEDYLSWANAFNNRIQPSSTHPTSSDTINTALAGFRVTTGENRYDAARSENDEKNDIAFRKVRRKSKKYRRISRRLPPSAAGPSPDFLEKRPSLPYPRLSKAHAREEIPKVPVISSENSIPDNGYQYMPTYDYRQDGEGLRDLSDGIVPTPPPHLEPVEPRQPQESELHTTTGMEAFESLVDEVLVAQKEHADFMSCPNVPKVSRKSTEEGHTEERMGKGEFSDTPYITRGRLKREKTMHFQGSHNSNDSHDDRELHEDELSSVNWLRLSSDPDPIMHSGDITATPTLPRAKSSSITPPQMHFYTPPEWPASP